MQSGGRRHPNTRVAVSPSTRTLQETFGERTVQTDDLTHVEGKMDSSWNMIMDKDK
jgi:hypothetical protein